MLSTMCERQSERKQSLVERKWQIDGFRPISSETDLVPAEFALHVPAAEQAKELPSKVRAAGPKITHRRRSQVGSTAFSEKPSSSPAYSLYRNRGRCRQLQMTPMTISFWVRTPEKVISTVQSWNGAETSERMDRKRRSRAWLETLASRTIAVGALTLPNLSDAKGKFIRGLLPGEEGSDSEERVDNTFVCATQEGWSKASSGDDLWSMASNSNLRNSDERLIEATDTIVTDLLPENRPQLATPAA